MAEKLCAVRCTLASVKPIVPVPQQMSSTMVSSSTSASAPTQRYSTSAAGVFTATRGAPLKKTYTESSSLKDGNYNMSKVC